MFNKLKKESQAMADELKKLTTEIEAAEKLAEVSNRYNLYSSILQNTHNIIIILIIKAYFQHRCSCCGGRSIHRKWLRTFRNIDILLPYKE